ncbi:MAG: hypothetical protein WCE21_05630 [Candidatus Babeliales bacterium]
MFVRITLITVFFSSPSFLHALADIFQPKIFKENYSVKYKTTDSQKNVPQQYHEKLAIDYQKGFNKYADRVGEEKGVALPDSDHYSNEHAKLATLKENKEKELASYAKNFSGNVEDSYKPQQKMRKEINELQKLIDANEVLQKPVGVYLMQDSDAQEVKDLKTTMNTVLASFREDKHGVWLIKQSTIYKEMQADPASMLENQDSLYGKLKQQVQTLDTSIERKSLMTSEEEQLRTDTYLILTRLLWQLEEDFRNNQEIETRLKEEEHVIGQRQYQVDTFKASKIKELTDKKSTLLQELAGSLVLLGLQDVSALLDGAWYDTLGIVDLEGMKQEFQENLQSKYNIFLERLQKYVAQLQNTVITESKIKHVEQVFSSLDAILVLLERTVRDPLQEAIPEIRLKKSTIVQSTHQKRVFVAEVRTALEKTQRETIETLLKAKAEKENRQSSTSVPQVLILKQVSPEELQQLHNTLEDTIKTQLTSLFPRAEYVVDDMPLYVSMRNMTKDELLEALNNPESTYGKLHAQISNFDAALKAQEAITEEQYQILKNVYALLYDIMQKIERNNFNAIDPVVETALAQTKRQLQAEYRQMDAILKPKKEKMQK